VVTLVILAAIVCGVATGLGTVYFRDARVVERIARASGPEQRMREHRWYGLWAKYPGRVLGRFGIECDQTLVLVGRMFYEGSAPQAFGVAERERREDLKQWLFELVKLGIQREGTTSARRSIALSVWEVLSDEQKAEISPLLDVDGANKTGSGPASNEPESGGVKSPSRLPNRLE